MDLPIVVVSPKNPLEEKIAQIAVMFDFTATKTVECHNLGNIVRFLGCAASKADLDNICKATEFEKALRGNISIQKLMGHLVDLLVKEKMKPATPNDLLKAFQVLDPRNTGYIEPDYFRELMLTKGEPLTEAELKEMMREALDPSTGLIDYEFYINKLVHKDFHVYEMAAEIRKERETAKAIQQARKNLYMKK